MGMFDWYKPADLFACPICQTPLKEWQGKDGPRALYVWQQGVPAPVEQACDEECKGLPEVRAASRLPSMFSIYSHDCERHCVFATCKTQDAVWNETLIDEILDLETQKRVRI